MPHPQLILREIEHQDARPGDENVLIDQKHHPYTQKFAEGRSKDDHCQEMDVPHERLGILTKLYEKMII